MKLFISHSSALFLIRQQRRYGRGRPDPQRVTFLPDMATPKDVDFLMQTPALCHMPQPVHYLVTREQRRTDLPNQIRHSVTRSPSARSFVRVQRDVYCSSPELCFVQLAKELDLIELINLGYELCGRYVLAESADVDPEYGVEPITSVRRLQRFVDSNSHLAGSKKARRALRYIRPNSCSPMETTSVMLLSLPVKLGGYAAPWPLLNESIETQDQYGRTHVRYCDLYWSDAKLAIEYDSAAFHRPGESWQRDSARRVELGIQDIEVVSVGPAQIRDERETEKLARLIARRTSKQMPSGNFAYSEARQRLRHTLMPWL